MRTLFVFFFVTIWAPLHGQILRLIAYGPWGRLHQLFIWIFKKIYKIEWPRTREFKTFGDFFLRRLPFDVSNKDLISPVQAQVIECAAPIDLQAQMRLKGLDYRWQSFREIDLTQWKSGRFWNFYLSPRHYHWVHSACSGVNLKAYYHKGKRFPVNSLGRWMCPYLYSENERISFHWQSEKFGNIYLICVAAVGVAALQSVKGAVKEGQWVHLAPNVLKAEPLLAFRLGSTAILLVERPPSFECGMDMVNVGHGL